MLHPMQSSFPCHFGFTVSSSGRMIGTGAQEGVEEQAAVHQLACRTINLHQQSTVFYAISQMMHDR
jgi:hypothetical protein